MLARLRAARWAHVITVGGAGLAAVAAIGGLWAQAVATYWTQQTAMDQLSQSREDSQREEQAQASQVTFWVQDLKKGGGPELHVLNRSLDPVTHIVIGVDRYAGAFKPKDLYYGLVYRDLPPCTERVYDVNSMSAAPSSLDTDDLSLPMLYQFESVGFVDSHGKAWARSRTDLHRAAVKYVPFERWIDMGPEREKKVDNCGDSRG
uniref:Uncharacterized protein n=1 Tax=Streptomyces sp. NBC_01393 TaxID=2903851 RepID=A0AAU3HRP1_9ACTN